MLLQVGQEILGNALHLAQLFPQFVVIDVLHFFFNGVEIIDGFAEELVVQLVHFFVAAGKFQFRLELLLIAAVYPVEDEDAEDETERPGQMTRSEPVITGNGKTDDSDEI